MEVADGTLRNWLAQHNPGLESREYKQGVPVGELLHVLREAAEVMDELHAKQVMHRDIKPDNILLLNRHAKVADFGLARHQDPGVATQSMMAGSPAYMAPEVWAGKFGAASDLYSLAVTYAELRQGRLPVKLGPMAEIMFAHLEGQFEFGPVFSKAEVAVVRRALAKEPGQRFESCTDFVHELVKVVNVPLALPGFNVSGTRHRLQPLPPVPTEKEAKETIGWEPTSTAAASDTPVRTEYRGTRTHVPNHLLTGGRATPRPATPVARRTPANRRTRATAIARPCPRSTPTRSGTRWSSCPPGGWCHCG
jgi:serine/threonine protein kinase